MSQVPNHQTFMDAYAGEAPWDIGRPQEAFVSAVDKVASPVLDAGCGTGDIALYLSERGHRVKGFDFLQEPIRRAREKAAQRGLTAEFAVADALRLTESSERYNTVIDSGLFHVFTDAERRQYVAGLKHIVQPGGRVLLMCFSDAEPPGYGPRRVSRKELMDAFAGGWEIESLTPSRFEINPKFVGPTFSEGGPKTWFLVARRKD